MTESDGRHTEELIGDSQLIERVRTGNTGAYATLYERHATAARGLARQLLHGEAEAEDAVAEAFTRVLSIIRRGGGPEGSFRPYLLTAVRNAAYDRGRGDKRHVMTEDVESVAPGQPFVDPALEKLERKLIARAFLSLPERWQSVLWHVEIEGAKPSEVAPLLGMKANGVAALAYRAREGLRQAYLQMHLAGGAVPAECRPTIGLLGAYVRAALSKRDTGKVDAHLNECADCREVYAELMDVNVGLRGVVLPLFVGTAATGYLASGAGVGAGVGTASGAGGVAAGKWWGRLSRRGKQMTVGSAVAAGVAATAALAMVGAEKPLLEEDPPPVSAPDRPAAEDPPANPDSPSTDTPNDPEAPAPEAPDPEDPPVETNPVAPDEPPEPEDAPVPEDAPEPEDPPVPSEPEVPEPEEVLSPPADIPEEELPVDEEFPAFAVGFEPVGALLPGSDGVMVLDVRNVGQDTDEEVVVDFTLPPGVETVSDGSGPGSFVPMLSGHGDWSCSAQSGGGTCVLPEMTEGENATHHLDVRVDQDAEAGVPGSVTITSGEITSSVSGEEGVGTQGVAARYATAGGVTAESIGNSLMTCVEPWIHGSSHDGPCAAARQREGGHRDNDNWVMTPLDRDEDPTTTASSSAVWEMPEGGSVRWAGLYFSGAGVPETPSARIKGPGMDSYETVAASESSSAQLPGYPAYQAFADVTELVDTHGGGEWWVADVPMREGWGVYAGWNLVVVLEDPTITSHHQVVVLDDTAAVFQDPEGFGFSLSGALPPEVSAQVGVTAWEGDADLDGDRVTIDGNTVAPVSGHGTADNAFVSSARGAVGDPFTFGTDVVGFDAVLGRETDVRIRTEQDALLVGVLSLVAPMRT